MMIQTPNPRDRVEQCRRLAQHIEDPAIRLAMLNQIRLLDQELAAANAPAEPVLAHATA